MRGHFEKLPLWSYQRTPRQTDVTPDLTEIRIERRLKELAAIFAVSVIGFSVLDTHFHLLLRLDSHIAEQWKAEEVVNRWFKLFPPRGTDRKPLPPKKLKALVTERLKDAAWVSSTLARLGSRSWFMKCLKEPLSRMVNKAEKCTGAFFEGSTSCPFRKRCRVASFKEVGGGAVVNSDRGSPSIGFKSRRDAQWLYIG